MSLDDALNEFGRLVQKPTPGRSLHTALTEGGDDTPRDPGVGEPAKLRNISPNQFSLPSMEHLGHPGAPYLAQGAKFHTTTSPDRHGRPYEHGLMAFGDKGQTVGEIHWAGSGQERREDGGGHYPGEVTWVGRPEPRSEDIYRDEKEGVWKRKEPVPHKGIMTAMYRMGHHVDMGQSTVPVHSPDRTSYGENWSEKVGPAHLRPPQGDFGWRPPTGIHPFERAGAPRQFSGPMEGQQPLPGMEGHSHERKVDLGHVLKNWIK